MKVIALVGMAGAGKSEVAREFEKAGYARIRFGDITDIEVQKRGLPLNESNERAVREQLHQTHGMSAYARLNIPRIDTALQKSNVVIDGLYSWEEYLLLKEHYGHQFQVVAVWSSPAARYARLVKRGVRPLTPAEGDSRDQTEIEHINKGGPIAMADFTLTNDGTLTELIKQTTKVIEKLK